MSAGYLWGVYPRSSVDPLVASGSAISSKAARREVQAVLDSHPETTSRGAVTGPRGYHMECRRDNKGGFTWYRPGDNRRGKKRARTEGRLYRDAQNDYWESRTSRARRRLRFRRSVRTALAVVLVVLVIAGAGYAVHRADPRFLSFPGFVARLSGNGKSAAQAGGHAAVPEAQSGVGSMTSKHASPSASAAESSQSTARPVTPSRIKPVTGPVTTSLTATFPAVFNNPLAPVMFGPGNTLAVNSGNSVDLWDTTTDTRINTLTDPGLQTCRGDPLPVSQPGAGRLSSPPVRRAAAARLRAG